MIVVVDSGIANGGSIVNMLQKIGAAAQVSANPDVVAHADRLVLPGVGAFDAGMRRLNDLKLVDALHEAVIARQRPVLGICLGMQLMTIGSEEGGLPGLGWIDAHVVRFRFAPDATARPLRVPHMGWNTVAPAPDAPLFADMDEEARFYFVHSYHVVANPAVASATTRYGYEFPSALTRNNIHGVQFHPEKSHRFGLHLLRNFVRRT